MTKGNAVKPICVIPARAGSKRIPGKNMQDLGGKPLVQWIIEAAVNSGIFQRIYVSTDSNEVMELAGGLPGNIVLPFRRPDILSGDNVRAEEVFKQVVEFDIETQPGDHHEIACMSMPTAPFTSPGHLRGAYEYMKVKKATCMSIVTETSFRTQRTLYDGGTFGYKSVSHDWKDIDKQSQDLPKTYRPTYGGMFTTTQNLLKFTSYYAHVGVQGIFEVSAREGIDIDTPEDLANARVEVAASSTRRLSV